jgi:hypothetical protein
VAEVTRTAPDGSRHVCVDAASAFTSLSLTGDENAVRVTVQGGQDTGFSTGACAGPDAADIGAAGLLATVPTRSLRRGGSRIDLTGSHPFAAPGVSGTVTSTLVVAVESATTRPAPRVPTIRRQPRVALSLSGSLTATATGLTDPDACAVVDACGLADTLTLGLPRGPVVVSLITPGLHFPGLPPGASLLPPNVAAEGGGELHGAASLTAVARRSDGSPPCSDSRTIDPLDVGLTFRPSGRVELTAITLEGADLLRTRCPGPLLGPTVGAGPALAVGRVDLHRLLAGHPARVHLVAPAASSSSDGYVLRWQGSLDARLRPLKPVG